MIAIRDTTYFIGALIYFGIMALWPVQMAYLAKRRGEDPWAAARATIADWRMGLGLAFGLLALARSLTH